MALCTSLHQHRDLACCPGASPVQKLQTLELVRQAIVLGTQTTQELPQNLAFNASPFIPGHETKISSTSLPCCRNYRSNGRQLFQNMAPTQFSIWSRSRPYRKLSPGRILLWRILPESSSWFATISEAVYLVPTSFCLRVVDGQSFTTFCHGET